MLMVECITILLLACDSFSIDIEIGGIALFEIEACSLVCCVCICGCICVCAACDEYICCVSADDANDGDGYDGCLSADANDEDGDG